MTPFQLKILILLSVYGIVLILIIMRIALKNLERIKTEREKYDN